MTLGSHGSTYGGNPLAMSIGNAVLDIVLEPGFLDRVKQSGLLLKQRLAELRDRHPGLLADVRGEGLMMGLKVTGRLNSELVGAARDHHLLAIGAGDNVVRLVPPLIVSDAEIAEAVRRLDAACGDLEAVPVKAAS